jgi:hypothetical protein
MCCTCLTAPTLLAPPLAGSKHEAAVYAALCGHLQNMLPVCSSWEDAAWAFCRAWLEQQVDRGLAARPPPAAAAVGCELVDGNLVVSALQGLEGLEGKARVQADGGVLTECYGVLQGDWPLARWVERALLLALRLLGLWVRVVAGWAVWLGVWALWLTADWLSLCALPAAHAWMHAASTGDVTRDKLCWA